MRGCVLVWAALLWLMAAGTAVAGASLSSDAIGGSIIRPPSGLYVLDLAIGFNVLDAAAIDPKSGRIMLVGHRDKRYGDAQIPYLELLACLLESPEPEFSLKATPESLRHEQDFEAGDPEKKVQTVLFGMYTSGHATSEGKVLLGLPAEASDSDVAVRLNQLGGGVSAASDIRSALLAAMRGPNGLLIDGNGIQSALGSGPAFVSSPVYFNGLAPDLELARRMFEGDYLLKRLIHNFRFTSSIPGYQTEFAYEHPRTGPQIAHAEKERAWISVGHLDLAQPPQGTTLEIRGLRMRISVRSGVELGSSVADKTEKPNGYESLITSFYESLAQKYPILHEISEAAKLSGVAQWIRARHRNATLPTAGLTRWKEPETVPGLLYLTLYIPPGQPSGSQNIAVKSLLVPTGGVRLSPADADSGIRDIHVDPVALDLNKTALASPPTLTGLPPGDKAVAWVTNVPGEMPYQVVVAGVSDISGELVGRTGMTRGPFGESQPVPNLAPANYPSAGSDTSALDQVRSGAALGGAARVAAIAQDASGNAKLAFDTSGGPGAPMPAPPPTQLGSPSEKIPAAVWNDQLFQKMLGKMKELNQQGAQLRAQIKQQEQVVASAPPDQKSTEEAKLSELYQQKSDNETQKNYVNFKSREKFNEDVTVTSEPETSSEPPAASSSGTGP